MPFQRTILPNELVLSMSSFAQPILLATYSLHGNESMGLLYDFFKIGYRKKRTKGIKTSGKIIIITPKMAIPAK